MLIVKVDSGIEKALKKFKKKFDNVKTIRELRKRKEFKKKSVKKRESLKKAIYLQKKIDDGIQ